MRKVWTAIFLFLLTTVVAGCALGDDEASVAELPPIPNVEIVEDKNEPVVMDVYWDATCSMQGYTTIPQNNIGYNIKNTYWVQFICTLGLFYGSCPDQAQPMYRESGASGPYARRDSGH